MVLKVEALKETRSFYKVELKKEDLTERERNKYSRALKLIEGFIKGKEDSRDSRERGKHKKSIPDDHRRAIFLNKRGY
ncbi:hypothetical protein ES695_00870 [Candidatus Atribacteria bacterium 1244-E10-H5-B2]|jgi:hypothetical protein|nr:MAG: hypothetical protein ES695_11460 [Candidatus Atribacteria bacterium 1244-E10-H5-B2]RXG66921.1 MAG: hypothetical protein ES695_00870 [Candidatus Atribacteria bacterium 1244-E10-H5-B2]